MSSELPVCVLKSQPVLIFPEKPTPKCSLYLSNIDNLDYLRYHFELLWVYRKSIPIEDLKSSLSKLLFHYYPFAGRIRNCANNEDRLEVDCNGKGALIAEGFMDFTVDEFLKDNTWLNRAWKDKLLFEVDVQTGLDIPPLVIQATYLSCGGMLMCIAMHHCMADGTGASKFLHDWAYIHTNPNMDLPIPPIHNREMLKPRNPLQVPFDHPEFTGITQDFDIPTYFESQTLAPSCLTITPSHIQHLKQLCEPSLKCTTLEALAAHVWRCYIKALNLPPSLIVQLFIPTSMKTNIEPNLPKGYYGNGVVLACAGTTVKDLVTAKMNHIVELIQNAKRRVRCNDYVRSLIDIIEEKKVPPLHIRQLSISDWRMLGFHELDFGEGKPLHISQLASDAMCKFLPFIGDSNAAKVLVWVPKNIVHKFEYYMMNDFIQEYDKLISVGGLKFQGKKIRSKV
ncbi:hypothetical protein C5167_015850 [Papaver somniferum]|uniref:Uncharacterized protein n=1 Tax=Papaver somniferum TaxID=3469 RepID=A0A4Y7J951_PAPSO|nr:fatty alcohol:caffeoyl-CoA acyltransferase-like [Papaver somniferum]RZC56996.1 hypothetical protein C5167_015850 [Papaver somniferum]